MLRRLHDDVQATNLLGTSNMHDVCVLDLMTQKRIPALSPPRRQSLPAVLDDRSSSGGSSARTVLSAVAIRDPALMPPPDAKPEYHNIMAVITSIDSEQTMYYMAAPDTGRKVGAPAGITDIPLCCSIRQRDNDSSSHEAASLLVSLPSSRGRKTQGLCRC